MPSPLIVAGTGTDVGKTVFSSLVMARYARDCALKYLKPIQTGTPTDTQAVRKASGLGAEFFFPELYHFSLPASPHYAAEAEGKTVDFDGLVESVRARANSRTIIELAGGLMVPLTRYKTNLDLINALNYPVVLVASAGLGTINHSVLSYRALTKCAGIFFVGKANELLADNIRTIHEMTGSEILGQHLFDAAPFDTTGRVKALIS